MIGHGLSPFFALSGCSFLSEEEGLSPSDEKLCFALVQVAGFSSYKAARRRCVFYTASRSQRSIRKNQKEVSSALIFSQTRRQGDAVSFTLRAEANEV
jgi:hypothetical protein